MKRNIHIKPGRGQSILGLIGGGLFCLIGITFVIPTFGFFGIIWTLFSVAITVVNGINAFSENGVATHEIVVDGDDGEPQGRSVKDRLSTLEQLYGDGTITNEEYEEKRKKILDEI